MFRRPPYRGFQQRQVSNENEASNRGRSAVDAIGECSLGRTMPNILRRVCRVSLVQHDMSMMKANLLVGIAVLLMATSAAAQSSGPGMDLYSGIARHPRGGCDELCRAKCNATWRYGSRGGRRLQSAQDCYTKWSVLNTTGQSTQCEMAHRSGQRIPGCQ